MANNKPPVPYKNKDANGKEVGNYFYSFQFGGLRTRVKVNTRTRVYADALRIATSGWKQARAEYELYLCAGGKLPGRAKDMTLDMAMGRFIEARSDLRALDEVIRRFHNIKAVLGDDLMVSTIDDAVIRRFKNVRWSQMTAQGQSKVSLNNEVGEIQRLHNFLVKYEKVTMPVVNWKAFKLSRKDLPKRTRFVTPAELDLILEAVRSDYRPILEFFYYTGLRKECVCNLKWRDVDWYHKTLRFRQKGDTEHRIHINETVERILRGEEAFKTGPNAPIWTYVVNRTIVENNKNGKAFTAGERHPISEDSLRSVWDGVIKRLGKDLGLQHVMIHDLRRAFCTTSVQATGDKDATAKAMGLGSTRMVDEVYLQLPTDYEREASRRHAEYMAKARASGANRSGDSQPAHAT